MSSSDVPPISTDEAVPEKLSKNALKKAAKEKDKAEKAAKRQEQEREERERSESNDSSRHLYGSTPPPLSEKQKFTELVELYEVTEEEQEITVDVWVHNARVQSAKLAFLVLREAADSIQAVVGEGGPQQISRQMVKWCGGIHVESYVRVTGLLRRPKEPVTSTSISGLELHVKSVYIIAEAVEKLPVQVKDCMRPPPIGDENQEDGQVDAQGAPVVSLSVRLNNRVLDVRAAANQAIFKLQTAVVDLFVEYMKKHNFQSIQSSKIVGAATEGGSGVFEMQYFESKAYLTQSPQFFKQMSIAMGMKRVYEIGPIFRAENSNTQRHLTEFTGLDFEMVIREHYHEVLSFGESLMIFILRELQTRKEYQRLTRIVDEVFPGAGNFKLPPGDKAIRITFAEAVQLLREAGIEAEDHADLTTSQEKALGTILHKTHSTDFFTIDAFPLSLRPFYTHPSVPPPSSPSSPSDPKLSHSYDFFLRGQEILSGAQRLHTYPALAAAMRAHDPPLDPESEGFKKYTEAFKYGCPPHGGGGFGLNRIVANYLGLPNVRLATLFVRDPGRLSP